MRTHCQNKQKCWPQPGGGKKEKVSEQVGGGSFFFSKIEGRGGIGAARLSAGRRVLGADLSPRPPC